MQSRSFKADSSFPSKGMRHQSYRYIDKKNYTLFSGSTVVSLFQTCNNSTHFHTKEKKLQVITKLKGLPVSGEAFTVINVWRRSDAAEMMSRSKTAGVTPSPATITTTTTAIVITAMRGAETPVAKP